MVIISFFQIQLKVWMLIYHLKTKFVFSSFIAFKYWRLNPEDIGSTSAAVFYCAPSILRFDTTINYRRCAVSFLMSVKRYRRLIFYVHNFSVGKFAALQYESGKLWSWRSPSAYQAFHHRTLNPSCTIFLFFTIDLHSKS